MDSPAAQGEQSGAQAPNQSSEGQPAGQNEGIQKRINELTAEKHEAMRELEAMRARENAYLAEIAARAQAPVPTQQVEVDPEFKKQLDSYMAPFQRQLQDTLKQLQTAQALVAVRTGGSNLPDPVRQEAERITADYARKGYAIESEMAYKLAAGEVYLKQLATQASQKTQMQTFNGVTSVISQQSPLPNTQTAPQRPDLNAMSPGQRIAWFEANGIGDKPL